MHHLLSSLLAALRALLPVVILPLSLLGGQVLPARAASTPPSTLDLQTRVAAQTAIEEVLWQHRLWPDENPEPKPALSEVLSSDAVRARVEDSLRQSNALETLWQQPITGAMLQAEMERMAKQTRQPELLRELFAALNDDPAVIAEVLARPLLADRLLRSWYAGDERFDANRQPYRAWWESARADYPVDLAVPEYSYTLAEITGGGSPPAAGEEAELEQAASGADDTWTDTPSIPDSSGGTSVWTGSEMVFWGGVNNVSGGKLQQGWSYNPATDTWTTISTIDAPHERYLHTAVWTGTEMIVWGGCGPFDFSFCASGTGGRYNPVTDTWQPVSNTNAAGPRISHTAVWTGSQMIIWGGCTNAEHCYETNSGGVYDPATDNWSATTLSGAPEARSDHTAVWSGSEMIVWGGYDGILPLGDGRRYNPDTNTWAPVSSLNSPSARLGHSALWLEGDGLPSEMLIWAGCDSSVCGFGYGNYFNDGARYDPATNTWTPLGSVGVPSPRVGQSAVCTGSQVLVWGGYDGSILQNGARYSRISDAWTAIGTANTTARAWHHARWTGELMLVWGGSERSGERYDPAADTWTPINDSSAESWRADHQAVWTGTEMIAWGGSDTPYGTAYGSGVIYTPATASWRDTSLTGAPSGRYGHTAIWTGTEMIVWGGQDGPYPFNTGGRYNPATDSWRPTTTQRAPQARGYHTAVWTGRFMLVWGGSGTTYYMNTGGAYDAARNRWITLPTAGAPAGRYIHTAVWTGQEMIVWGGVGSTGYLNSGGRFNLATRTWTATSASGAPTGRYFTTGVWTGSEMVVWGGRSGTYDDPTNYDTGGRYNPGTDTWQPTSLISAPDARSEQTAVWTGQEMIVWGGSIDDYFSDGAYTGGRYSPVTDLWRPTRLHGSPMSRTKHTAVWTGTDMIVWGGMTEGYQNTGGQYSASYAPDATPPVITDPAVTILEYDQGTVVWTTDEGATSQVEYGLDANYGSWSAEDANLVFDHSVPLTGLTPETEYHFRIHTRDWAGNVTVTGDLTFTTPRIPDTVLATRADYWLIQQRLEVGATSSDPTATLSVYDTDSGAFIGTMVNNGDGTYSGIFTWWENPSQITVRSSYGGEDTRVVIVH